VTLVWVPFNKVKRKFNKIAEFLVKSTIILPKYGAFSWASSKDVSFKRSSRCSVLPCSAKTWHRFCINQDPLSGSLMLTCPIEKNCIRICFFSFEIQQHTSADVLNSVKTKGSLFCFFLYPKRHKRHCSSLFTKGTDTVICYNLQLSEAIDY